jgi:hypothetical protein
VERVRWMKPCDWLGKGFLNRPVKQAIPQNFTMNPKFARPLCAGHGFTIEGDEETASSVIVLNLTDRPAAVSRLVVAIVIDAIKAERERKIRYNVELSGETDPKQLYVTIVPTGKGKQINLRGNPKLIKKAILAVLEIQEANSHATPANGPASKKEVRPRVHSSRKRIVGDRKK